ncbi:hypothetical protein [Actinokineospora sp.]|uniref:hypothetical protein n=1 Tax=Actinokineospora sp. TaxID=1872133 RepID=UPI0040381F6F
MGMPDVAGAPEPTEVVPGVAAERQVEVQIALGRVKNWVGGLFGREWDTTVGGGGAGGEYQFADLAELDEITTLWRHEYDAIYADGLRIRQAIQLVRAPAEDEMSTGQARAFADSLERLYEHNKAMLAYADGYLTKLRAAREQMAATEDANTSALRTIDGIGQ